MYDLAQSKYLENLRSIKIGDKQSESLTQGRGVRQDGNLSQTLFNVYINEVAVHCTVCSEVWGSFSHQSYTC